MKFYMLYNQKIELKDLKKGSKSEINSGKNSNVKELYICLF